MQEFVSIAEGIAREAGALLRDFYHRGVRTEYKGDVDLVTEADRASEKLITERFHAALPQHGVFGEEGTRSALDSEFRWYVDPLDGTTNFAHGFPAFCVVLGCEQRAAGLPPGVDGRMVAGVIYDPLRDEMFSAARGRGARLNGVELHVSRTSALQEALVATGFPSQKRHRSPNVHFYQEFTLRSHGVRRAGSAALDLAYVAAGRLDAFWEFKLNPWDTSAGFLLVEEAGGRITRSDGSPFRLDSEEVFATNGLIHAEMQTLFADMFAGRGLQPIPTPQEFAARRAAGEFRQVGPMRLRRSARVLLFDPDGDLLLIRFRAEAKGRSLSFWVTPGGEIEPGEAPEEAAGRELYEELGLALPLLGPVHAESGGEYEHLGERVQNEDIFFATVCERSAPRLAGVTADEIRLMQEVRWWSPEDLRDAAETVYPGGLAALAAKVWAVAGSRDDG